MLYQLGSVSFDVAPVNIDKATLTLGSDYAAHEVIGAQKPSESVGQADSSVRLSGKLLPANFGMGDYADLQGMATSGTPQMLIRGDGTVMGWMLILRLNETHTYLDATGVGRIVDFEIEMKQSPDGASADAMISLLGALVSSLTS